MTHPPSRDTVRPADAERPTRDVLTAAMVEAFAATFDRDVSLAEHGEAPLGIHWLCGSIRRPTRELGPDGHPARDTALVPATARRMWGGGALTFHHPLRIGDVVERSTVVASVTDRQGATGPLTVMELDHLIRAAGRVAIEERQTLVYRHATDARGPAATRASAPLDVWPVSRTVTPGPVLLFRYSAITFNGHRIHYDRPYAVEQEGYPGLVVHAPLTATLLLDLAAHGRTSAAVHTFRFRFHQPAFGGEPLVLEARESSPEVVELRARTTDGRIIATAQATIRAPDGPRPAAAPA